MKLKRPESKADHPVQLKEVKRSRYRSAVAERLGRVIALLFNDRGNRRG